MRERCRNLLSMRFPASRFLTSISLALALLSPLAFAQQKEIPMTYHAHGTFTVKVQPLPSPPAEGLSRYSLDKQIQIGRAHV